MHFDMIFSTYDGFIWKLPHRKWRTTIKCMGDISCNLCMNIIQSALDVYLFHWVFPLPRLARNIMVTQKLCVLRKSAKMLLEQERMEVIHGGFFVSWTGSRKADKFLSIYIVHN